MELQDLGNAVQIGDRKIPAVNIQILDWPHLDELGYEYGTYFEIPVETGALIIVSQKEKITMEIFPFWNTHKSFEMTLTIPDWEKFLTTFDSFISWITNAQEGEVYVYM